GAAPVADAPGAAGRVRLRGAGREREPAGARTEADAQSSVRWWTASQRRRSRNDRSLLASAPSTARRAVPRDRLASADGSHTSRRARITARRPQDRGGTAPRRHLTSNLDLVHHFYDVGTAGGLKGLSMAGGLPTYNFQEGSFAGD